MVEIKYGTNRQVKAKSRKGLVLLAALLITILVTGGLFAYTSLITSTSIAVAAATSDYASITLDAAPPAGYKLVGSRVGSIGSGKLFDIDRSADFTGDLEIQVYLTNIDELVKDYSFWMVRVEVQDADGDKVDANLATLLLSLQNPIASFPVKDWEATRYVVVTGGSYRALPFSMGITGNDPLILAQVVQVGN
jgi:hypothetical protein